MPEQKDGGPAFHIGDAVIYEGRTYTFPGEVCAVTDDGQIVVRAYGDANGYYAGMKHIYGPAQLRPFHRTGEPR